MKRKGRREKWPDCSDKLLITAFDTQALNRPAVELKLSSSARPYPIRYYSTSLQRNSRRRNDCPRGAHQGSLPLKGFRQPRIGSLERKISPRGSGKLQPGPVGSEAAPTAALPSRPPPRPRRPPPRLRLRPPLLPRPSLVSPLALLLW